MPMIEVTKNFDGSHSICRILPLACNETSIMIGELNEAEIDALLKEKAVGRIACHEKDFIYLVPLSYAYDGQYIYIRSLEGTKVNIMRKNPQVCFEVDDITDMANWKSVIAWGR